ncbi:MAG: site-2 protease family protein [Clostridiales bacterium]|nr:site-2 protease family protein [Clostridiales bacterium]
MSLLLTALFGDFDIRGLLMSILVLSLSLSLHEFSHAWMAYKMGDSTAADLGRLTLNPLKHLDPMCSLVFLLTRRIGWAKPVPINPARFSHKRSMRFGIMMVSLAGPLSNILLAIVSYLSFLIVQTIYLLANQGSAVIFDTMSFVGVILELLFLMFWANLGLAVFNLLPMPPLDGYKVFGAVLPSGIYYKIMQYEHYIGMAFLILVFFGRGIISKVMSWILYPLAWVIQTPLDALFKAIWQALF